MVYLPLRIRVLGNAADHFFSPRLRGMPKVNNVDMLCVFLTQSCQSLSSFESVSKTYLITLPNRL
jgi:hypothetical protein